MQMSKNVNNDVSRDSPIGKIVKHKELNSNSIIQSEIIEGF